MLHKIRTPEYVSERSLWWVHEDALDLKKAKNQEAGSKQ
jgi:hypothetical protein